MKALVAARRVAMKTGRQLCLHWPVDNYHCLCDFDRLFDVPVFQAGDEFCLGFRRHEFYGPGLGPTFVDPHSPADCVRVLEENFFWVKGDEGVMWGQHGPRKMANEALKAELLEGFDWLRPRAEISREADRFAAAHFGPFTIGVHARREDNWWSNAHCPDHEFAWALDVALDKRSDATLFVATDGPATEDYLRKRYGDRVITYPVRSLDRGRDPRAIVDALTTLLLLSRAKYLVRSTSTTFSQVAAWVGRLDTVEVGRPEHKW
jgi:hypothetical protein